MPAIHQHLHEVEEHMKLRIYAVLLASAAAIILARCGQSETGASGLGLLAFMSSGDTIAELSQSSLETVNDSMTDINTSGETDLSYRVQYPGSWQGQPNLQERLLMAEGNLMGPLSARAA